MMKKMRVTGKDVAQAAGVSPNTVSLVMRDSPLITEETKSHVLRVSQQLGYQQNAAAAALRSTRSRTIGYLLPEESLTGESDVFRNEIIQVLVSTAKQHDYYVLVDTYVDIRRCVALVQSGRIDGLILDYEVPDAVLEQLIPMNIPMVVIGRDAGTLPVHWVKADEAEAAYAATTHLLQAGHRQMGMVSVARAANPIIREREAGYRRALHDCGIVFDLQVVARGDWAYASGFQMGLALLQQQPRPTGLFVVTEILAAACIRAAQSLGLAVPDDLAIVTIGDSLWIEAMQPRLTAVRIAMNAVGQRAAAILFALIEQPTKQPPAHIVLPPTLVIRESSRVTLPAEQS